MSALNDWMTAKLGANWKTSLTGWATALMSLVTALSVVAGANGGGKLAYWIACVSAVLSALAKILNGIVAADAVSEKGA